ncbi:hypothetical protein AAFF_G00171790 [Aldrovandia affinis]|uniref:Uncharacterized protein n=1 Tax=Aldrovandia affinis TaxID=143900 RepID=A0AAD7SYT3_9TELE|nr:hypothetical protein AAFF_G00171790 [Aldrovandia affinis]
MHGILGINPSICDLRRGRAWRCASFTPDRGGGRGHAGESLTEQTVFPELVLRETPSSRLRAALRPLARRVRTLKQRPARALGCFSLTQSGSERCWGLGSQGKTGESTSRTTSKAMTWHIPGISRSQPELEF